MNILEKSVFTAKLKAHLHENNCTGVYFQFDSNGDLITRNYIEPPDLTILRQQNKINSLLNEQIRNGAL